MDAFYGTWKVQLDKTTGVPEFGKLFGWSDEKINQFLTMEYTLQVESVADGTRCLVDYGIVKFEFTFKLGEQFDYTGVDGLKAKCTATLDGGKLFENFLTDAGIAWKTVREISGSTMTTITTLVGKEDVKCTQVFQKV